MITLGATPLVPTYTYNPPSPERELQQTQLLWHKYMSSINWMEASGEVLYFKPGDCCQMTHKNIVSCSKLGGMR